MSTDNSEIVLRASRALSKYGSGLVRRGLDDLSKSTSKKGRILLVNDQEFFLQAMEKILLANGYEVQSTSRHQDAIALARSFDPQVAVVAIATPEEVRRGLLTASLSWPFFTPKVVLWSEWGELQEFEDLDHQLAAGDTAAARRWDRAFYDLAQPTSVRQESLFSAMHAWMAEAWTNRANPLHAKDQWLDALKCHEKALAIDARCFNAWLNKAWCLDELGRWDEAIDGYERAIEINASDWTPWVRKGDLLDRAGRYEEAILCFDSALAISQDIVSGWMGRGLALHHLGRYEKALLCYDKVFEVDHPTWTESGRASVYSDAWNAKGTSLYRMGRYQESIECYEKAIANDPKSWLPWYNEGNSLREMESLDEAVRCYDKAIELWPEHAGSWNNKGICLRKMGRLEEALSCHEKAHSCNPADVLGWYNKGLVEEDLGRIEGAIDSYENYLAAAPDGAGAADAKFKDALERLVDLKSKNHASESGAPRYAYVVREEGAPIEAGTIGYPNIETAILEGLKQKAALCTAGELSDEAYRGAVREYRRIVKEHLRKKREQP